MKSTILTIIIAFALLSFSSPNDWYYYEGKSFASFFPKKPKKETEKVSTEVGKLSLHSYMYEPAESDNDENLIYSVTETEYPAEIITSAGNGGNDFLLGIFRGAIDGAVKNVKGKLITEEVIAIDGFPGREVKVDYNDGVAIIRMRLYMVHNRMYILQTIAMTKEGENISSDKFFNSFKLIL